MQRLGKLIQSELLFDMLFDILNDVMNQRDALILLLGGGKQLRGAQIKES